MARVRSIQPGTQEIKAHKTELDCFHQVVLADQGMRLLHLSSFGADDRRSAKKSSQSFQLDETMAKQLLSVIRSAFPGLA